VIFNLIIFIFFNSIHTVVYIALKRITNNLI